MNKAPENKIIETLIQQATVVEKGPPSHCLTYNTEIRRLDPHKLVKLVVAVCAEEVTRELTAFGDNGDFLFGHFGISKE